MTILEVIVASWAQRVLEDRVTRGDFNPSHEELELEVNALCSATMIELKKAQAVIDLTMTTQALTPEVKDTLVSMFLTLVGPIFQNDEEVAKAALEAMLAMPPAQLGEEPFATEPNGVEGTVNGLNSGNGTQTESQPLPSQPVGDQGVARGPHHEGFETASGKKMYENDPLYQKQPSMESQMMSAMMRSQEAQAAAQAAQNALLAELANKVRETGSNQHQAHNTSFLRKVRDVSSTMQRLEPIDLHAASQEKLDVWMEKVMDFVCSVDPSAKPICQLVRHLKYYTFSSGATSVLGFGSLALLDETDDHNEAEELEVNRAELNYDNVHHFNPLKMANPPVYSSLTHQEEQLDKDMFIFVLSQIKSNRNSSGSDFSVQYQKKVQINPNFGSFAEVLLYAYSTKAMAPLRMWAHQASKLDSMPTNVNFSQDSPIREITREIEQIVDDYCQAGLQEWQRVACKIYQLLVAKGRRNAAKHIEDQVTLCLEKHREPKYENWINGARLIMEQERQYHDVSKAYKTRDQHHDTDRRFPGKSQFDRRQAGQEDRHRGGDRGDRGDRGHGSGDHGGKVHKQHHHHDRGNSKGGGDPKAAGGTVSINLLKCEDCKQDLNDFQRERNFSLCRECHGKVNKKAPFHGGKKGINAVEVKKAKPEEVKPPTQSFANAKDIERHLQVSAARQFEQLKQMNALLKDSNYANMNVVEVVDEEPEEEASSESVEPLVGNQIDRKIHRLFLENGLTQAELLAGAVFAHAIWDNVLELDPALQQDDSTYLPDWNRLDALVGNLRDGQPGSEVGQVRGDQCLNDFQREYINGFKIHLTEPRTLQSTVTILNKFLMDEEESTGFCVWPIEGTTLAKDASVEGKPIYNRMHNGVDISESLGLELLPSNDLIDRNARSLDMGYMLWTEEQNEIYARVKSELNQKEASINRKHAKSAANIKKANLDPAKEDTLMSTDLPAGHEAANQEISRDTVGTGNTSAVSLEDVQCLKDIVVKVDGIKSTAETRKRINYCELTRSMAIGALQAIADSGAAISVAARERLKNIRILDKPIIAGGFQGHTVPITHCGELDIHVTDSKTGEIFTVTIPEVKVCEGVEHPLLSTDHLEGYGIACSFGPGENKMTFPSSAELPHGCVTYFHKVPGKGIGFVVEGQTKPHEETFIKPLKMQRRDDDTTDSDRKGNDEMAEMDSSKTMSGQAGPSQQPQMSKSSVNFVSMHPNITSISHLKEVSTNLAFGQDPVQTHKTLNHRSMETVMTTLKNTDNKFNGLSDKTKKSFVDELQKFQPRCDTCLATKNRLPIVRRKVKGIPRMSHSEMKKFKELQISNNRSAAAIKAQTIKKYEDQVKGKDPGKVTIDPLVLEALLEPAAEHPHHPDVYPENVVVMTGWDGGVIIDERPRELTVEETINKFSLKASGSYSRCPKYLFHNSVTEPSDEYADVIPAPFNGTFVDESGNLRRLDINNIKPYQYMFFDLKTLPPEQMGLYKYAAILVDYKSMSIDVQLIKFKNSAGQAFRAACSKRGVQFLPYQTTVHYDGDGANASVIQAALEIGCRAEPTIPYRQSLNMAELAIRMITDAAKKLCFEAKMHPCYLGIAMCCAAYTHSFVATTTTRGSKTPYEILWGVKPNIDHLRQFGSLCWSVKSDPKRKDADRNEEHPLEVLTKAEPCIFIGYQSTFGKVYKLFTMAGQIIHTKDVYWADRDPRDPHDLNPTVFIHGFEKAKDWFEQQEELPSVRDSGTLQLDNQAQHVRTDEQIMETLKAKGSIKGGGDVKQYATVEDVLKQFKYTRQELLDYVLDIEGYPDVDEDLDDNDQGEDESEELDTDQGVNDPSADLAEPMNLPKQLKSSEGWTSKVSDKPSARTRSGATFSKVNHLADEKMSDIQFEHEWNESTRFAHLYNLSAKLAKQDIHANKDMSWPASLKDPIIGPKAIAAFNKELDSLTTKHNVLTIIAPGEPDYERAKREACWARALLDIKRDSTVKARFVKRGDLENKEMTDGPDYNYYAHVVGVDSVRIALATHNTSEHIIGIADVSTAFLQSHPYDKGVEKFIKMKNPTNNNEIIIFRQHGPIYGENSAPSKWEDTIAPWIEEQGLTRGKNEPCVFYCPKRDLLCLLYVDDIFLDGKPEDVHWFYGMLSSRFETKPLIILEEGSQIDYLGMEVSKDKMGLYVSMQEYTSRFLDFMGMDGSGKGKSVVLDPYNPDIEDDPTELDPKRRRIFMSGLGMVGWLTNCFRADLSYSYSRIAQHMATPTEGGYQKLLWVARYLKGTYHYGAFTPNRKPGEPTQWRFFTDSDLASDRSVQNKGKSRSGYICLANGFPICYKSKTTSVAMCHPSMVENHADVSSAAAEIYASGNSCMEFLHLSYCVSEMGKSFPRPFVLEMDNKSAEVFCKNTAANSKLRHIDQRMYWVQALRDSELMVPRHIHTKLNVADMFTKALTGHAFRSLRDAFLVVMNKSAKSNY